MKRGGYMDIAEILKKWKSFAYPLFLRNFAASN